MARRGLVTPRAALVLLLALSVALDAVAARKLSQGNDGVGLGNGNGQGPPSLEQATLEEQEPAGDELQLVTEDPFDARYAMAEDELVVKFKAGATEEQKGKALGKGKGTEMRTLRAGNAESGDLSLVKVQFSAGQSGRAQLKAQAAQIRNDEDVEYVEPNFLYKKSQTNDPYTYVLWGMLAENAGANAVGAWNKGYTSCSDVVIGIIDEGIQVSHPDLAAHMWVNPRDVVGDGIDNDGNGKVDDVNGWDFVNKDSSVYDGAAVGDQDTHGTHVAGTIGAVGNNGQGLVGVCQSGVKMISAKFLGPTGGSLADAVSAMYYLLDLKTRHNLNLVATSNSWGGGGYAQSLYDAIAAHRNAGILFIAAAGNEANNNDAYASYPASYTLDSVISVGAIDSAGAIASFSNYGATSVDVFAPGVQIASTYPVSNYVYLSGTSMATPMVTGAVALFAAAYKQATGANPTAAAIKAAVMDGTADSRYTGKCVSGMRLNIAKMLDKVTAAPPPPSSPAPPPPPPAARKMYVQFSLRVNKVSTTRSSVTVSLTVRDSITTAAIPGVYVSGQFTINPDVACTDVLAAFPVAVAGTLTSGAGTATSPSFQNQKAAASCLRNTAFPGSRVTFTITGLTAAGYEIDTTKPSSVVSALI